jgi:hypothetical protein
VTFTAAAVALNEAETAPVASEIHAGILSVEFEDDKTTLDPAGAGPESVMVHFEEPAPVIAAGAQVIFDNDAGAGGSTTSAALFETPPSDATT